MPDEPAKIPDEPDFSKGIGDSPGELPFEIDPRTTAQDLRLLRTAALNNWPILQRGKQTIIDEMLGLVKGSRQRRIKIAAARVVVTADSVNARREATAASAGKDLVPPPTVNVTINNQVGTFQGLSAEEKLLLLEEHRKRIGRRQQVEPGKNGDE